MLRRFMQDSARTWNSRNIPARNSRARLCAQPHLQVKVTGTRLVVPVNALLFRSEGLRAVAVDANYRTHLKPLTIGRDYGTTLEVLQGLDASDWIVLNPADSLEDGQEVRVKETAMTP